MSLTVAEMLTDPGVVAMVEHVAKKVAWSDRRRDLVELDDVRQDAYELVAGKQANLVRRCLAGENGLTLGVAHRRLEDRLVGKYETTERRARRTVSADERYDESADRHPARFASPRFAKSVEKYDADLVAALVPSIWDPEHAWSLIVQNAPDADMPRSSPNYSNCGEVWARRADIDLAWRRAPLSSNERQVVFLVLGLDLTHDQAAQLLGVHQSTVSRRLAAGLARVVQQANNLPSLAHEKDRPGRFIEQWAAHGPRSADRDGKSRVLLPARAAA